MSSHKKGKIDPETGLLERSVNLENLLELKNIPSWSKPKGKDLF